MLNQRNLLIALVVLLAVRFAIVPWMEWQQEAKESFRIALNREVKGQLLLEQQDDISQKAQLWQTYADNVDGSFPRQANDSDAQFFAQQQLQAIAKKHDVKVELFNWVVTQPLPDVVLQQAILKITVSGIPFGISAFQADIENVSSFSIAYGRFNWPSNLTRHTQVAANFDINFYYQQGAE